MRMFFGTALFVVVLLLPNYLAFAGILSWTDREGNTHVTDDISKVPSEYQTQAKSRFMEEEAGSVPAPNGHKDQQPSPPGNEKKAARYRRSDSEVTDMYGRGEEYWRGTVSSLRQQLQDLQEDYQSITRRKDECDKKPVDYRGRRIDCDAIFGYHKDRLQKQIDITRKALEVDLPDAARKAGALPGWLR